MEAGRPLFPEKLVTPALSRRQALASASLTVVLACLAAASPTTRAEAMACSLETVGIDTSLAMDHDGPFLGQAMGQVFLAPDTLLASLTVWGWAGQDTSYAGWHLWITETDSLGNPLPRNVLLDGPTSRVFYGDGVHPVEHRYSFDPPFVLPHRGKFFFAINNDPCDGSFQILLNVANAYPDGAFYLTERSLACVLREAPAVYSNVDLVFEMEFCRATTPTVALSWGALKDAYR